MSNHALAKDGSAPAPARRTPIERLEPRVLLTVVGDFNAFMTQDEEAVRALMGNLTTLNNLADVSALALRGNTGGIGNPGFVPTHFFDSFNGMGLAFADLPTPGGAIGAPTAGQPMLLLYSPTQPGNPVDEFPDFPYRFIGWGYGQGYEPRQPPTTIPAIPSDAWCIHEAGYHPLDGGFIPTPPNESLRGSADVNEEDDPHTGPLGAVFHERLWDIHFFTRPGGGTPGTEIKDPFGRNLPGQPNGSESFFFPDGPFNGTPLEAGRIQAEDFDTARGFGWRDNTVGNATGEYRFTDIDISPTNDGDGSFDVSSNRAGEFLAYTVDVSGPGEYDFAFRLANNLNGATFNVEVDGVLVPSAVTGSTDIAVPNTGGFTRYQTIVPFSRNLTVGQHRVKITWRNNSQFDAGAGLFNWFSLTLAREPSVVNFTNPSPVTTSVPSKTFTVTYDDNAAIRAGGIGPILVRGPNNQFALALLESRSSDLDASPITATYRFDAPGGMFDPTDNGAYELIVDTNQVFDTRFNALPRTILGTLTVNVPFVSFDNISRVATVNGTDQSNVITFAAATGFPPGTSVLFNGVPRGVTIPTTVQRFVVNANGGNDVVNCSAFIIPVDLRGGLGNDRLIGGNGDDRLNGGDSTDTLRGNGGNDTASNTAGDDVDLGAGEDGIEFIGTDGNDLIRVERRLRNGLPQVLFTINGRTSVSDYRNGETVTVRGGRGDDLIDARSLTTWKAHLFGEDGHDILLGGQLDDLLDGGDGHDLFAGGAGADRVAAQDGETDLILLGAGDVILSRDEGDVIVPV